MIFKKIKINKKIIKNRIVVSPMCQYSGDKGSPSSWHYQHLGKLSLSGAGMLMVESTSINKVGMITHKDLALYNNVGCVIIDSTGHYDFIYSNLTDFVDFWAN